MSILAITSEPQARREELNLIRNSVDEYNLQATQVHDYRPINIFIRDEGGVIRGGILADLWGGWLHVTFLWVEAALRKQGYGARLLQMAEDEAQAKGGRHAYVETFSFQARPFYEKHGYQVLAQLPDYPPGHTYFFMRKSLG